MPLGFLVPFGAVQTILRQVARPLFSSKGHDITDNRAPGFR